MQRLSRMQSAPSADEGAAAAESCSRWPRVSLFTVAASQACAATCFASRAFASTSLWPRAESAATGVASAAVPSVAGRRRLEGLVDGAPAFVPSLPRGLEGRGNDGRRLAGAAAAGRIAGAESRVGAIVAGVVATTALLAAAPAAASRRRLSRLLAKRRRPLVSLAAKPEPGEAAIYVGAEKDIPRHRAFNFYLWDQHRKNPERYVSWFAGIFQNTTVINRLKVPLAILTIFSTLVVAYDKLLVPQGFVALTLPLTPFLICSAALALLLVFRVDNANARYNEARNIWGKVVNVSRDLMMQAKHWDEERDRVYLFLCYISAFSAALMCHLRVPGDHSLKDEINRATGARSEITDELLEEILIRPTGMNAPMFITDRMRRLVKEMKLTDQERLVMEWNLSKLVGHVGMCERVLSTPIPVGYSIHTTRFLLIWLLFLPLALQAQLGFSTVLGELILGFGLLGIEDVGIMLEEPFCVLPLEAICNKIGREARSLRGSMKKDDAARKAAALEPASVGAMS